MAKRFIWKVPSPSMRDCEAIVSQLTERSPNLFTGLLPKGVRDPLTQKERAKRLQGIITVYLARARLN